MIIVTGASDNHYLTLINMIKSYINYANEHTLIVYNLGLNNDKWLNIQNLFLKYNNIIYKIFDYSKYPSWFNINIEAGQYAWKPTIIYNTFLENKNETIIWMDSGNLILEKLNKLEEFTLNNGIYSFTSSGDIQKWTHPETIKYLNCTFLNNENRNAACIGFNTSNDFVKDFLLEFYNCAQTKECICPDGSSRDNHRQDQAVFTILYYKYKYIYKFISCNHSDGNNHLGYSIHNDID
jgi:hypothetical protein